MSVVDDLVLTPLESVMDSLGLMRGSTAPLKRAIVGAGVGAGIVYGIKPAIMFDDNGEPRPWAVTNPDAANATMVPFWMGIAAPAVFLSVFI